MVSVNPVRVRLDIKGGRMTEPNYTKGEWKVKTSPLDSFSVAVEGEDFGVAMVTFKSNRQEQLANAHLIAASPDTAEALQELISFLIHDGFDTNDRLVPIIKKGTKALKKAGLPI